MLAGADHALFARHVRLTAARAAAAADNAGKTAGRANTVIDRLSKEARGNVTGDDGLDCRSGLKKMQFGSEAQWNGNWVIN
jgi:hypothetical protein